MQSPHILCPYRLLVCTVLAVVVLGVFLVYLDPVFVDARGMKPTDKERKLFDEFMKKIKSHKSLLPHPVNAVIDSFDHPVEVVIEGGGGKYSRVKLKVSTHLDAWRQEKSKLPRNKVAGYFWIVSSVHRKGKTLEVTYNNSLALDPDAWERIKKDTLGELDLERLFYHELLHGQLMIDAMKDNKTWRKNALNGKVGDFAPMDKGHKKIRGLETGFLGNLAEAEGKTVIRFTDSKRTDENGNFKVYIKIPANKKELNIRFIYIPADNFENVHLGDDENGIYISGRVKNSSIPSVVIVYVDPPMSCVIHYIYLNDDTSKSDSPVPRFFNLLIKVSDGTTGDPITSANVEIYDSYGALFATGETNASGMMELNLPTDTYHIKVKTYFTAFNLKVEASKKVTLSSNTVMDIRISLLVPVKYVGAAIYAITLVAAISIVYTVIKFAIRRRAR